MGVLIRAGDAKFSMSYKSFGQLRRDLAALVGLDAAVDGTAGWPERDRAPRRPGLDQHLPALVFLLDHPDSEGYLLAHQCERLVPALTHVIGRWVGDPHKRDWVVPLAKLRNCCRHAADNHTALEFT